MPGQHTRNAGLGYSPRTAADHARLGTTEPRLWLFQPDGTDGICFVADDEPGLDAVKAIHARKYTSPARTLARRREVVERAQEAAQALGWVLTAGEQAMLEAF
jgi:hypothetical protein